MFTVMLYDMIPHSSQPVKITANRYVLHPSQIAGIGEVFLYLADDISWFSSVYRDR